ncbi:MAG: substrate-binding domain-containing protein [Chitinivibrionales bacterium]|nr:substrate-binding domain-containing protein [Chitinivibrionales bacterium]
MNLTMKDVADDLGVSRTTVSLVLKGDGDRYRISRETQEKILKRIKELNFRPNFFAKSLNAKKTNSIGVVFPNIKESSTSEMIEGIEKVLSSSNYTMTLCSSKFDKQSEVNLLDVLKYKGVDGFVIACNSPFEGEEYRYDHIESLVKDKVPVVFIDRYLPGARAHYVVQNDEKAAHQATNHLLKSGARCVGYISFDLSSSSLKNRFKGYAKALVDNSLPLIKHHVINLKKIDSHASDLEDALKDIMSHDDRPDAFLIATNGISFKALTILTNLGFAINKDFKIAKFGKDPEFLNTGMICIEQPSQEMGTKAAELVLDIIENADGFSARESHVVLEPALKALPSPHVG